MANKAGYKTTFEPERVIQPLHTGGSVSLSQNGRILATCLGEDALLTDITTDRELARIEGVSFYLSHTIMTQANCFVYRMKMTLFLH